METEIIFEDEELIVAYKPWGFPVQSGRIGVMDMESELKNYLAKKQQGVPYLSIIHRLDQPVEGILVFAKTKFCAAQLNKQLLSGDLCKKYYAVVYGDHLKEKEKIVNYMVRNPKGNIAQIVDEKRKDAKRAELFYTRECVSKEKGMSLLKVEISTGRFHQIRAQLAYGGFPILGDLKYGSKESKELSERYGILGVSLCASFLEFQHPSTGKRKSFSIVPRNVGFLEFKQYLEMKSGKGV